MPLNVIISVLFIHWIADFVCQSDWQAKNKSKNNKALSFHVLGYSTIMMTGCYILNWMDPCVFGAVMILTHYSIDYVTSRLNSWLWKNQLTHYFFVSVGFDQFLHYVTIFTAIQFLK